MNMFERYNLVRMRVKRTWEGTVLFSYVMQLSLLLVGIGLVYAYVRFFTYQVLTEVRYGNVIDSYFDGGLTLGGDTMSWMFGFIVALVTAIVIAVIIACVAGIISSTRVRRRNREIMKQFPAYNRTTDRV